jgi:MFS transporter, SET family, sugar efflux transporter
LNLSVWSRIWRTKYGAALGSCILLQGILMAIFNPLLPVVLSEKIGLDKEAITVYFLMIVGVDLVISLITGYISDGIISRYKLVLIGGLISTLGFFGIATAIQPQHVFIAGALSVGLAVLFPQLFAVAKLGVVGDWERESQVIGITVLRTLFSFGYIVGTASSSVLARIMDIQTAFFIIAVVVLALTAYASVVLYRVEGFIKQNALADAVDAKTPAKRTINLPAYALVVPLIALVVLTGADNTRQFYLSLTMFQLFADASIAPLMFGITAAAELITMGLLGYLSSKTGEKIVIAASALTGALYFVVMAFSQSLPILYGAQIMYAINVAALYGVAMAYVQRLLGERAGLGGGLYMMVLQLGSLVGILGPLLVTGYDQRIFIIPAILCIVGAALLMVGDRTAQIEKRLTAVQDAPPTMPVTAKI